MNAPTYLQSINAGLHDLMAADERVVVLGEDILDPYGGAFKATKGLSTEFPDRVFATPISEAAIAGLATGLAIRGFRPVAEIMFGDFITLITDQIVNTATKFPLMYEGGVTVPMVIRTPMGGGRGYGPTHSQCLEKLFFGVPGLKVIAPSLFHDPGALLRHAVTQETGPVLFIENKLLYSKKLVFHAEGLSITQLPAPGGYPVAVVDNFSSGTPDAILLTYGGGSLELVGLLAEMAHEEIRIRAILPSHINPQLFSFYTAISPKSLLVIYEEGTQNFNWSSELSSQIYEHHHQQLSKKILRLSPPSGIVPASESGEKAYLVTKEKLSAIIIGNL